MKKLKACVLSILLSLAAIWQAVPVMAAGNGAEEIRAMEEQIVEWKRSSEGEESLLMGNLLDNAGEGGSDWWAFIISRMGTEDKQAAYLSRLRDAVEKIYQDMEASQKSYRLSDIHRIVLTVRACGGDPTNFGTDPEGNPIDLVRDSVWNSLWGDPGNQGINGYIWALIAADSGSYEEPEDAEWTREKLITAILSRQLADGGFGLILTDDADVDLTSMALTALAPYGGSEEAYTFESQVTGETVTKTVPQAAEEAFACNAALMQKDGTMITRDASTSESTSWAMMALAAWGRDPGTDEQFQVNGKTLLDGLREFQLEDGGIRHSLDDADGMDGGNMAGYQAAYSLEAVYRLKAGQCGVFDLSDAPEVTEEEIQAAGEALPELTEDGDDASGDGFSPVLIAGCAAGAVVLAAAVFLALVLREKKKKKTVSETKEPEKPYDDDDDEDDDW